MYTSRSIFVPVKRGILQSNLALLQGKYCCSGYRTLPQRPLASHVSYRYSTVLCMCACTAHRLAAVELFTQQVRKFDCDTYGGHCIKYILCVYPCISYGCTEEGSWTMTPVLWRGGWLGQSEYCTYDQSQTEEKRNANTNKNPCINMVSAAWRLNSILLTKTVTA